MRASINSTILFVRKKWVTMCFGVLFASIALWPLTGTMLSVVFILISASLMGLIHTPRHATIIIPSEKKLKKI